MKAKATTKAKAPKVPKETVKEIPKAKAPPKPKEPAEIVKEIGGELKFQRTGGGMATFKAVCPDVLSNPIIQFKGDVLPADYDPQKHSVTGEFAYKVTIKKK